MNRKLLLIPKTVLPILVIGVGVMGSKALVESKEAPARQRSIDASPVVEVMAATPRTERVTVEVMGVVKPSRTLVVMPQVGGAITSHHPQLVPGGYLRAGEPLVGIDKRDYQLAVSAQAAQVARAELEVRVEKGRRSIAEREWEAMEASLGAAGDEGGRDLALRDPQIAAASASLAAARSAVKSAKLGLSRTEIEVPFNAVVKDEAVEVGQVVGPASRLATLIGTDTAWVEASVPVEKLAWLAIPGVNAELGEGSPAVIMPSPGGAPSVERHGKVLRLLGEVDPAGRMARLLIEIPDPYGLTLSPAERGVPLLVGSFVRLEIEGRSLDGAFALPRLALRDGNKVWTVSAEGTLTVAPVEVGWREATRILVTGGLEAGDRVVTSVLAAPVPGMLVRVAGDAPKGQDGPPRPTSQAVEGTGAEASP